MSYFLLAWKVGFIEALGRWDWGEVKQLPGRSAFQDPASEKAGYTQ